MRQQPTVWRSDWGHHPDCNCPSCQAELVSPVVVDHSEIVSKRDLVEREIADFKRWIIHTMLVAKTVIICPILYYCIVKLFGF